MRPILKISVDAVIWSLVRGSPSVMLASAGKASFCLIITKSHDLLRGKHLRNHTKHNANQLYLGMEHNCPPTPA